VARTGAKSVILGEGLKRLDVVVVAREGRHAAFVNSCPHQFTPLETFPDYFFDGTGDHLVCSTHGARFEPLTGYCVLGPCKGESLEALSITEKDGTLYLSEERSVEDIAQARRAKSNW